MFIYLTPLMAYVLKIIYCMNQSNNFQMLYPNDTASFRITMTFINFLQPNYSCHTTSTMLEHELWSMWRSSLYFG